METQLPNRDLKEISSDELYIIYPGLKKAVKYMEEETRLKYPSSFRFKEKTICELEDENGNTMNVKFTMGRIYRHYFWGVQSEQDSIFSIFPTKEELKTIFVDMENIDPRKRTFWLQEIEALDHD
jgi:hypothetical protein